MVRKEQKRQPRGRSGGRAGGSGYDFQDLYIALQLAKLLVGDRDRPIEILWEKKAVDWGSGAKPLYVDDVVINRSNGKKIYVQVKENAPSREWTTTDLIHSGVLRQFWNEWRSKSSTDREKTVLRLASAGSVLSLNLLVDVARRARTPSELLSDEASANVEEDIRTIGKALSIDPNDAELLEFIKSIEAEQLPSATELEGWIQKCLVAAGENAIDLSNRLLRSVSQSKHVGSAARSSFTRESLIKALRESGVTDHSLIALGVLRAPPLNDAALWDKYRASVVENFRSFRVYGLQVERAVYADLPALFVPLRLAALTAARVQPKRDPDERRNERTLTKIIEGEVEEQPEREREAVTDLSKVFATKRRIAIVGGPGTGKTTTLRWLAIICALPGDEGGRTRVSFGLTPEPLVPVYVRFRQFSERFQQRGLHGVEGRVGLVSDFLAAQFEAGLLGTAPSRSEGLQMAQELLESEQTVLLFDGLDEVADEGIRTRLFEAVADLIQKYKAPRVIVSSRPYAFRTDRSPLDLELFEPLPLDRAGRRTFANQWYRSVRSHLGTALTETQAETLANDLAKTAESVSDLAEIPLLLSILALVHFNRQGLPVERATLYDYASLAMLGHWERDPAGRDLGDDAIPADWSRKLQLNETGIRRVVEHLAHDVQCGEGGEFDQARAISALAEGFSVSSPRSEYSEKERAELLLRLLVDRSGLVQERDPGIFAFAHLSFQEYLAARWFVGRGESGLKDLAVLARDERHGEVVRLAVAILASDQRTEADERARRFIMEVTTTNAVIAAASLIEVPRLQLEPAIAESLARSVWFECSNMFRRHYHPRIVSRLIWMLLAQTTNADRLLLEFLSDSGDDGFHGKRGMMEFESGVFLLRTRPPGPASPELRWVLRRLAQTRQEDDFPERANNLADLLLVEAGVVKAVECLESLIYLLGESRWSRRSGSKAGDGPENRAERFLAQLIDDKSTQIRRSQPLKPL